MTSIEQLFYESESRGVWHYSLDGLLGFLLICHDPITRDEAFDRVVQQYGLDRVSDLEGGER